MKKIILLFVIIFYTCLSGAQEKTIYGTVSDSYTKYRIKNVIVSPSLYKDTVFTNENGKFKIVLPRKYRDTIIFLHPDYYTHIDRINAGDASRPQFIKLIPKSFKLDTIFYTAFEENILIRGVVSDDVQKKSIAGAELRLEDNKLIAFTDMQGEFEVAIPKTTRNLIINHSDFKTTVANIAKNTGSDHYLKAQLVRKIPLKSDTSWMKRNNVITLSIFELIGGGIGLRYERFLKFKHSIGLHSTYYFRGHNLPIPLFNSWTNKFTGLKLASFYRFYVKRKYNQGMFAEGKFITGYFNFSQLYYVYSDYPSYSFRNEEQFWSFGGGLAWGWSFKLPKTKHGLMNLSIGYQFFPMNVPETITEYNGGGSRTYHVSRN